MESTFLTWLHASVKCMQVTIVQSTRLCVAEHLWPLIPWELMTCSVLDPTQTRCSSTCVLPRSRRDFRARLVLRSTGGTHRASVRSTCNSLSPHMFIEHLLCGRLQKDNREPDR